MTFRKTLFILLAVLTVSFITFAVGQRSTGIVEAKGNGNGDGQNHSDTTQDPEQPDSDMAGVHWAKGHGPKAARTSPARSSPLMTFHGGQIMTSSVVQPVYWGASPTAFPADKTDGLNLIYAGIGGSAYMGTNTEYTGANGTVITTTVASTPGNRDVAPAPTQAPSTSTVLAEVAKIIGSTAVANGYYPVYVDLKRGSAGYCAWHSWGSIVSNGVSVPVQFAFFFNLDGDPGCNPGDTWTTHSQGLAALANVSGHELSEAVTDPRGAGWYDRSGAENADKCAWTFGANPVVLGGTSWKIQGNWSNKAYNNSKGYVRGCIDGN